MSWIAVSASLPELYQDVLVALPNEEGGPADVYMAARVPEWRITLDESGLPIEPTHWMPLPAAPVNSREGHARRERQQSCSHGRH